MRDLTKSYVYSFRWRWLRRAVQLVLLVLFFWLFRQTESKGTNDLNFAANIFFRLDPLVFLSALLAGKQFILILWPALVTVVVTLVAGRFFCGWICPLGTLLDLSRYMVKSLVSGFTQRRRKPVNTEASCVPGSESGSAAGCFSFPKVLVPAGWRQVKFFLLAAIVISALFGMQLVGYFNPFSILVRGLTVAVDPWLTTVLTAPFTWLLHHAPEAVTDVSEPVYGWLKAHLLAFNPGTFAWSGVSLSVLVIIFVLELFQRRFFCRNLCPTGALLGLLARLALLRRLPVRDCNKCKAQSGCSDFCRMGAFDEGGQFQAESCNLCLDCVDVCPQGLARFNFKSGKAPSAPYSPSRRLVIASLATGVTLPVVAHSAGSAAPLPFDLIRPPGARPESEFLDLCVRCGECLKVCTTNALQPALFESGLSGIFSPRLMPRRGYCEYNCMLCSQVCPTGAIKLLPLAEKQKFVMGLAVFNKKLCLPFAKAESCLTCEEHCPLPEKAIRFKEVEVLKKTGERVLVKQPFTIFSACIGCGICVTKCPLDGQAGVEVVRAKTVSAAVRQEYGKQEKSVPAGQSAGEHLPY